MASSIRRIVAEAVPLVAAVVLALGCSRHDATPAWVPWLVIETGPAHPTVAAANDAAAAGAELLLNAMNEPERDELAKSLAALADDIAVKRNPLVEELDDSYDAKSALGRELFQLAPRLSVATALVPGCWASAEGDFVVRAADRCPDGALCVRATGEATEARARFVAWPLAHSVVLRVSPSEVEALRAGARVKGSTVALVLDAGELHDVRASPALLAIAAGAAKVLSLAPEDLPHRDLFTRLASASPPRDPAPWLRLPEGATLVTPRISALSSRDAFEREVRAGAPHAEWLARFAH